MEILLFLFQMSDNFEDSKGENPMDQSENPLDQSENPLDQSINPWQVDSVQAFLYLHCPECVFVTPLKEQGNFQDHAIENHPLSLQGVYGKLSVKKELNSEENLESLNLIKTELASKLDSEIKYSGLIETKNIGGLDIQFHKCPTCDSSFERMSHLKRHISSVHEDKRPHACTECEMKFKQKYHLKRHFSRAHGTEFDPDWNVKEEVEESGQQGIAYYHKRFFIRPRWR